MAAAVVQQPQSKKYSYIENKLQAMMEENEFVKGLRQIEILNIRRRMKSFPDNGQISGEDMKRVTKHIALHLNQRDSSKKTKIVVDLLFYYLLRDEKPGQLVLMTLDGIRVQHPGILENTPVYGTRKLKKSISSCDTVYEMCVSLLGVENIFDTFYNQLGNNPSLLKYLVQKQPGLILTSKSHKFINRLLDHLNFQDFHQLISEIHDNDGRTALFHLSNLETGKSYQKYANLYKKRNSDLYSLISTLDTQNQTALHVNTFMITWILTTTYSPKYREELNQILNIRTQHGKTALDLVRVHDELGQNELRWLKNQVEENRYVLYGKVEVLIIYTTKKRPGAEEEARSIYDVFKRKWWHYNITFTKDKTESEIDQLIKDSASTTRNGLPPSALIVVLLSHGRVGAIDDCKGKPIPLTAIEAAMCQNTGLNDKPKILITQCCQGRDPLSTLLNKRPYELTTHDAGPSSVNRTPFVPYLDDFCAIMSSVSGQPSDRGVFIPKLAQRIENCKENIKIQDCVEEVSRQMKAECRDQIPIIQSTLRAKFCLANRSPILFLS